jgi:hypothetical protein
LDNQAFTYFIFLFLTHLDHRQIENALEDMWLCQGRNYITTRPIAIGWTRTPSGKVHCELRTKPLERFLQYPGALPVRPFVLHRMGGNTGKIVH